MLVNDVVVERFYELNQQLTMDDLARRKYTHSQVKIHPFTGEYILTHRLKYTNSLVKIHPFTGEHSGVQLFIFNGVILNHFL